MTTTRFDLSIRLANDAMQTPNDVADALIRAARRIELAGDSWYDTDGVISDSNGNTVGTWKVDAYSSDD